MEWDWDCMQDAPTGRAIQKRTPSINQIWHLFQIADFRLLEILLLFTIDFLARFHKWALWVTKKGITFPAEG